MALFRNCIEEALGREIDTTQFTITGEAKKVKAGLVDYVADGYIERDGDKIPCLVGLINGVELVPTHLFIKDGVTDNGTHYYAETIEL